MNTNYSVKRALTPKEVSILYGLNEHTLRAYRARNQGPPFARVSGGGRPGRGIVLYPVDSLSAWLTSITGGGSNGSAVASAQS